MRRFAHHTLGLGACSARTVFDGASTPSVRRCTCPSPPSPRADTTPPRYRRISWPPHYSYQSTKRYWSSLGRLPGPNRFPLHHPPPPPVRPSRPVSCARFRRRPARTSNLTSSPATGMPQTSSSSPFSFGGVIVHRSIAASIASVPTVTSARPRDSAHAPRPHAQRGQLHPQSLPRPTQAAPRLYPLGTPSVKQVPHTAQHLLPLNRFCRLGPHQPRASSSCGHC